MKISFLSLFLFYLLYAAFCSAQDYKLIDSLKLSISQTDSAILKIRAYKDICWEYATTRTKLDSATMYADSIYVLSSRIDYENGIALSHFYYGVINRFKGKYYEGINHVEKYIEYNRQQGDSSRMASGLFQYAVLHSNLGNYQKSLGAYYRVFNIHQRNENKDGMGFTLHSIGNMQRKLGKQLEAINSYEESIKLKEVTGDIGGIWMSYLGLGNTYGELQQYAKAEANYLKALSFAEQANQPYGIATVYENIGNLYILMSNYQKALPYLKKSLYIKEKTPGKAELAYIKTEVGKAYLKMGNLDSANVFLHESLAILDSVKSKPLMSENYLALAELYEKQRNYESAYKFQQMHILNKDSIFNTEMTKQLAEIETKYQMEQKTQEIVLLTKENELKQQAANRQQDIQKAIITGAFLILAVAGLLIYTLRQKLKNQKIIAAKDKEIKIAKLREQLGTLEMKALRAQMNPHFLFNCINSINKMILIEDNENASIYLTKFSKLIRLILENSEHQKVSLLDEWNMLTSYIELESIRFNNRIEYKLDLDDSVDMENTLIPSMILQPFVENAIWHGLLPKAKKGTIRIKITEEEDHLHCSIIDDGIGREASMKLNKESKHKKSSMGIKITADRLKLMTKEKIKEVIDIIDLKDEFNRAIGTQVNILIPIS